MKTKIGENLIVGIAFLCIAFCSAQNSFFKTNHQRWKNVFVEYQDNFRDSLVLWPERVVLQIANSHLDVEEPLFFKAYLLKELNLKSQTKSGVLNLELFDKDGIMLKRQFHKIEDGTVQGNLAIPKNVAPGYYTIKAYTRWSLNYGSDFTAWKRIQIGKPIGAEGKIGKSPKISILPEGGTFISGQKNRVIIKFPNDQTGGVFTEGRILDKNRQEVAKVSFYSLGLGTAVFTPRADNMYQLELEDGSLFPVPKVEKEGYLLHVNNLDRLIARVRITSAVKNLKQEVSLIGISGNLKYFEKKLNFKEGNNIDFNLYKSNFPEGVFTLKLVNALGLELAKRPIWIDKQKLQIVIDTIHSDIESDLKTFKFKVLDQDGQPVGSQMAVSINKLEAESDIEKDSQEAEKVGHLNNSESFSVNETSYYRKVSFLRDLEVLWSNKEIDEMDLDNDGTNEIQFSYQKGLEITGEAYDLNGNLLKNMKIQIFIKSEKEVWMCEVQTNEQGILKLEDIQIEGRATLIARTNGNDVKSRLVKIIPFNKTEGKKEMVIPQVIDGMDERNTGQASLQETLEGDGLEKIIKLNEVELIEKKEVRKKQSPSVYGIEVPSNRVKFQDVERPKSLPQLLSELSGVRVSGFGTLNPSASILGAAGPILWVLDGFPMSQDPAHLGEASSGGLGEVMSLTNYTDIERVELLKGADAAVFGTRGSGGVIAIYTRRGNESEYIPRKESELMFEGYTPTVDYNDYLEELSKRRASAMNLLYWNPNLKTDKNGGTTIKVPLKTDFDRIKVEVSVITSDGKFETMSKSF